MATAARAGSRRGLRRRLIIHIALRLVALSLLVAAFFRLRISGVEFWVLVALGIAMVITLLPYVLLCVVAFRNRGRLERNAEGTDDSRGATL